MQVVSRPVVATLVTVSALLLGSACGGQASDDAAAAPSDPPAAASVAATAKESTEPSGSPSFPVPVEVGNATQVITVRASGSYATVTAWQKGSSGWKSPFSTAAGRVGSNGATAGCVSVPRDTMDRIMSWISPSAHPRIAIG